MWLLAEIRAGLKARLDESRHPPPVSEANSFLEQPAGPLLQTRRTYVITATAALFVGISALDIALAVWAPVDGPWLYILPITLVALLSGLHAGLAAATLAAALTGLGAVIDGASLSVAAYVALGSVFLLFGCTGLIRDKPIGEVPFLFVWYFLFVPFTGLSFLINLATYPFTPVITGAERWEPSLEMVQAHSEVEVEELSAAEALTLALSGDLPASYQLNDVDDHKDPRYRDVLSRLQILIRGARSEKNEIAARADDLETAVRGGDLGAVHVIETLDAFGLTSGIQVIHIEVVGPRLLAELHERTESGSEAFNEIMKAQERKRKRRRETEVEELARRERRHKPVPH